MDLSITGVYPHAIGPGAVDDALGVFATFKRPGPEVCGNADAVVDEWVGVAYFY